MPAPNRILHHITSEPTTLVACLMKHFRLTEERAKELISLGAIYSNKLRVLEDIPLEKGRYLRIHLEPKRFSVSGIPWKNLLRVQTDDFIVVLKPPGIPVHATVDNHQENVLSQMRLFLGKELFATQRLDIPVEGLLVLAKTKKFQSHFNRLLLERKVIKRYLARTSAPLAPGRYVNFMEPSERSPKKMSREPIKGWQECILTVENSQLESEGVFSQRILLETGRTHQIRAQLALLGAPLLGDPLYGGRRNPRLCLYCIEVGWEKRGPYHWDPGSVPQET